MEKVALLLSPAATLRPQPTEAQKNWVGVFVYALIAIPDWDLAAWMSSSLCFSFGFSWHSECSLAFHPS